MLRIADINEGCFPSMNVQIAVVGSTAGLNIYKNMKAISNALLIILINHILNLAVGGTPIQTKFGNIP